MIQPTDKIQKYVQYLLSDKNSLADPKLREAEEYRIKNRLHELLSTLDELTNEWIIGRFSAYPPDYLLMSEEDLSIYKAYQINRKESYPDIFGYYNHIPILKASVLSPMFILTHKKVH